MSEAAPQAASGLSADEVSQGIRWLELMWGDGVYQFSRDAEGYVVRRKDAPGFLLRAADLTEMGEKLSAIEGAGGPGRPS